MAELVFIPCPGIGHLVSIVQVAKLLVQRDSRLSITVFIINPLGSDHMDVIPPSSFISHSSSPRIRLINLPQLPCDTSTNPVLHLHSLLLKQKLHVEETVQELFRSNSGPDSPRLAGFVVDMFCTPMIDVAQELGVPSYIYHPSGAQFLCLSFYLQGLQDEQGKDASELMDRDGELVAPGFLNPIPAKVLPKVLLENKEVAEIYFGHVRKYRETKGILVNTFVELESQTIQTFFDTNTNLPPVYPVGPMLKIPVGQGDANENLDIIKWLDDQPASSVVLLCFGSRGSFHDQQVKEIAYALERSRYRFLWSLRQSGPAGKYAVPSDYANPADVLPEGFLDRTAQIGRVIGWAPQIDILAQPAVGGFVSHCGWNSTLESIWFGVPMATWPLYAEQQFNAFSLLKEFGLAVEIRMDYRKDFMSEEQITVSSEEIEKGIRGVMELDDGKSKKVKEMSEKAKRAVREGGSSFINLERFIDDIFKNMP